MRSSSATVSSQIASSITQVCSAGQITDASKVFEMSMSTTAMETSALRWMYTGALPGPTLTQGLPASFAAATALGPPVVQMKSMPSWWNRYCETSSVGSGITWRASGGSPARSPASWRIATARSAQRAARAEGRKTIALRVFAATIALKSTVEVGFVIGVSASTTPIGSATYSMPRSGSSSITPTERLSFR